MSPSFDEIRERLATLDEAFRARPIRERAILAGGAAALVFLAIDSGLIQPATSQLERTELAIDRTQADLDRLRKESAALSHVELTAEEQQLLEQKQLLERQLREVDSRIASEISELVPPKAIVSVLEEMLSPDQALSLVSLQSLAPERLGASELTTASSQVVDATPGLYRHGLRLEIEGNFDSTVDYLRRIEESPWNLFWDRFEYRVQQFPTATVTIDLHTISKQQEWIGV